MVYSWLLNRAWISLSESTSITWHAGRLRGLESQDGKQGIFSLGTPAPL